MGSVTHTPKAGAVLTGTEYEAADHHVIALDASDIPTHSHAGEDITSGTVADGRVASTLARDSEVSTAVSDHEAAADPHTGYVQEASTDWVDLTDGGTTVLHSHTHTHANAASIYVQAGDPGAVGAGTFWLDTSGNLNIRNSADSAWIVVISGD